MVSGPAADGMDFFLADDLSGALDAAGAFHRAGRGVKIVLSLEAWGEGGSDEDVVAVTTETRNALPAEAAAAVARAISHGRARGGRLVYKKIDSTLRGPVAAELGALAAAMPEARILFAPANPAVGRTVCDGVLLVRGVPVAETEFGRDPVWPVKTSHIRTLLGDAAAGRLEVPDTETEHDLSTAVARMDTGGGPWVAVGSGALARPVAARDRRVAVPATPGGATPGGAVLMVCGSAHPGNHEQARVLAESRGVASHELAIDQPERAREAVASDLRSRGGAMLRIESQRRDSARVVRVVADTVAALVAATGVRRVFVTGGETAFALCARLGISALTFLDEIEPGLSLSRGQAMHCPLALAIKPGGFGDLQTWVRAWDALCTV
jgi:uncharacterized protein YgbK (DUF1537 family)